MLKTALVFSYDLLLDFLYWKNFTFETRTYKLQVYIFQCMNFLLFFFLFFCWDLFSDASFFFDTVSLVTWCGRGNVGYYSETDRVVEHREMGLRQVEIAFSLILANFLNDFFKEEHNKMLEIFWIGLQIACQKGGQKEAKKHVYTKIWVWVVTGTITNILFHYLDSLEGLILNILCRFSG